MLGNLRVPTTIFPLPATPPASGQPRDLWEEMLLRKGGLETGLSCLWLVLTGPPHTLGNWVCLGVDQLG